jgi:hypothetical protein
MQFHNGSENLTIFSCPRCEGSIVVDELNCQIFRHAQYKNGTPFPPHASKEFIEQNINNIFGCGAPLRYENGNLIILDQYY